MGILNRTVPKSRISGALKRAEEKLEHDKSLRTERADEADKLLTPSETRLHQAALDMERANERDKLLVASPSRTARADERDKLNVMSPARARQSLRETVPFSRVPSDTEARLFEAAKQMTAENEARRASVTLPTSVPASGRATTERSRGGNRGALNITPDTLRALEKGTPPSMGSIFYNEAKANTQEILGAIAAGSAALGYTPRSQRSIDEGRTYQTPEQKRDIAQMFFDEADRRAQEAQAARERLVGDGGPAKQAAVGIGLMGGKIVGQVASNVILPGSGTAWRVLDAAGNAMRDYRTGSGNYDPGKALVRGAFAGGGTLLAGMASGAVNEAGTKVLRDLGQLNRVLPHIDLGAKRGFAFGAVETAVNEVGQMLTDENYSRDDKQVAVDLLSSTLFGALSSLIDVAITAPWNKQTMLQTARDVSDEYQTIRPRLSDGTMTPEQSAMAARQMVGRITEMQESLANTQMLGAADEAATTYAMLEAMKNDVARFLPPAATPTYQGPVQRGPMLPVPQTAQPQAPAVSREELAKNQVEEFAGTLGTAGGKTLTGFYNGGDATGYIQDMNAYYNAGKSGGTYESITGAQLTEPQSRAAYIAGKADGQAEKKALQSEAQAGTMEKEAEPKPDWERVVNSDRISQMSTGESKTVKSIFEKPQQKPQQAANPQQQIADEVRRSIEKGISFNSARLFEIANKAYGGTMAEGKYTVKDAYDGMELAVNQYLMASDAVKKGNGDAATAKKTLSTVQSMLDKLPTQSKRSEEQQLFQQFSTPPNIAYLAAWTANVDKNDVVLEPSAGIGGLALWPKAWGAKVYGNELSERRLAFLNQLGLDGTFNLNAEQINNLLPDNIKPSVVIMNPPFSSTAGRMAKNSTANAKRHIEQALDRLEDGGRLVAILGNGMSDDAASFKKWWNELREDYSIRANIRIDGENYKKYGTTWDVQMVVIDKTGPQMGRTITGEYKDLGEIPGLMEGIRNDRTRMGAAAQAQPNPAVAGVQAPPGRPAGRKPVSGAGAATGTGRESTGLEKQREQAAANGVENDTGSVGRASGVTESGVQPSDNKRGPGQRGNERLGSSERSVDGAGERGQAVASSGSGNGEPKLERVQPGRDVSRQRLKQAAKEASENPDSVYSAYIPQKARVKGAKPHPAKLVESAAMAAVEPPDVTYTPDLPQDIVSKGVLSDAQLENVIYAGQAHAQTLPDGRRKGFFIGDGTGVGKGRQISGIIMDNFRQGRDKAVWISEKSELINDAQRDWTALGGDKDDVIPMKEKFNPKKPNADRPEKGIVFGSYDTLKTDKDNRISLLKEWLGKDFDGVIVFDEAHNMGNAVGMKGARGKTKPSAKATAGIELQKAFPNARVVYASATGATEASNYAYLERLGLWGRDTAFNDFTDFMSKISNGGLAAMELVARDMKAMGLYMARSISYDDVTYDTLQHDLTPMQTEIYNTMSSAWQKVLQNVNKALEITGQSKNGQARGAAMSTIYGTQQRFYNQILTSMSMPSVISDIRSELDAGRSVVIQIVNTNEAAANRAIAKNAEEGGDLDDLDLTPSDMLVQMVQNSFPVELFEEYTDENGTVKSRPVYDAAGAPVIDKKAVKMRDALIDDLKMMKVPDGPLEMLFDAFGEENVAEVTGRTRRVVEKVQADGSRKRVVERRSSKSGVADANMFQDGKKRILVFSDAGGTGRSYHADLTAKNQQQRVHYLLQPGWEASKAVQGFGRTHRSNQANAPIFKLVTTNVMGQKRFTSTIARRLDQLGALTKGQRQTGSGVFGEKDNLENPIAQDALSRYYRSVDPEVLKKLGLYDKIYDSFGRFNDKSDALRDIGKFLNRILSLEVEQQNEVFQGFYDTFETFINTARENGTLDMGLENYRADKIEVADEKVIRKDPTGADTKYVQMTVYRKPSLTAYKDLSKLHDKYQGIVRLEDGSVRAVYEISGKTNERTGEIQRRFKMESPVKGKESTFLEKTMQAQTKPIPKSEWAEAWKQETAKAPEYDTSTLHLLTGTLLPVWNRLPQENARVMRVMSSDGRQYLGRVIRPDQIDGILRSFGANRTMKTYSGAEIGKAVLGDNKEAVFRDDRVKLVRSRVSGEWRLELTGPNVWFLPRQYPGLITERIDFKPRVFVPTGASGEKILDEIMRSNPVVDVQNRADTVRESRDNLTPHPEQWTAKRAGDKNKTPKPLSDVIEQLRHDFGLNITVGHIRGAGIRGQYNEANRGIRTKIANDLPTAAHELGHHFDARYGITGSAPAHVMRELVQKLEPAFSAQYKPEDLPAEGIAEYLRRFLQNSDTAAIDYPLFTDWFKRNISGHDLLLLEQLADEVNAYYSLDAETATSSIRFRSDGLPDARTYGEKIKDVSDEWYSLWVDALHGIKLMTEQAGDDTAYKLAINSAYADCVAGAILTGDLTDIDGQYVAPGLKTALQGVNLKSKKEYQLFGEYLTVKHAPKRLENGMRILADDRKNNAKWMQARQEALEQEYPEFAAASGRLYQFIWDFYQTWGVKLGLIPADAPAQWRERLGPFYVPLNRAVPVQKRGIGAKRGFANQNSTVHRAYGSGLDIVNPVDNLINNVILLVNAGIRNNVMQRVVWTIEHYKLAASLAEKVPVPLHKETFDLSGLKNDLAGIFSDSSMSAEDKAFALDTIGSIEDFLSQFKMGKAKGNVVTVLKNGKPEFWKINDPLLLRSLTNMSASGQKGILDAYAVATRFMTSAITGYNALWSLFSNFPRDFQTLLTYTNDRNVLTLMANIGSAYVNKFRGSNADPMYKEYLSMGGGQTSVYTADRDVADKTREKLTDSRRWMMNPLEWLGFIGDLIESGPRYATYKSCRENGMSPQEAIYAAHDITVNFRKAGTLGRETNKVIPFFNASVQGLDKFGRWITAKDVPQNNRNNAIRGRIGMYVAVSAALGALFYALNNKDEESKKNYQQLSNYTKNTYWCIPLGGGKYFTIPKARELSVLTSLFETLAERYIGENKDAFDEFWDYATDNFFPPIVSDLFSIPSKGLTEAGYSAMSSLGLVGVAGSILANRDFLGRPIVSASMQYLEKKDQYNRRTSMLAKEIGQALDMSPVQIDYFFQQTLGGFWKYQKALFPVGGENRDLSLGIQGSYIKDNQYSTDLLNRMYERKEASAAAKKSDPGNMEKAIAAKNDEHMTDFYGSYYKLAKEDPDTAAERGTRQLVLDMIAEYQKNVSNGFVSNIEGQVYDVVRESGDTKYLPSVMNITVKDSLRQEHALSAETYVDFQLDYNRRYWEYVEATLPGAGSQREREAVLLAAKDVASETAKNRILKQIGAAGTAFSEKFNGVDDTDAILFKAAIDIANDDGGLSQQEVIAAIDALNLSKKESSALFHTRYTSDKNNPYK